MKRQCPYCKEMIDENLTVCPFCYENLPVINKISSKICPYCGGEIKPNAKKCKHCGKWLEETKIKINIEIDENPQTKMCPFCGKEILSSAKKCKHCGQWLENIKTVDIKKSQTKKCPYCGEEILAIAKKCKNCKKWLPQNKYISDNIKNFDKTNEKLIGIIFIMIFIIIGLGVFLSVLNSSSNNLNKTYSDFDKNNIGQEVQQDNDSWENDEPTIDQKLNTNKYRPTPAPKPSMTPTVPKVTDKPKSNIVIPTRKDSSYSRVGMPPKSNIVIPTPKTNIPQLGSHAGTGPNASPSGTGNKTGSGLRFVPTGSGSSGTGRGTGNVGNPRTGNSNSIPRLENIKKPDFGPYMRDLQQRIKSKWEPPKGEESRRVVVLFTIAKDGELLSKKIIRSSGLQAADDAAMAAVSLSAPFKPLPDDYKENSVDIQFTFDYNVFSSRKR